MRARITSGWRIVLFALVAALQILPARAETNPLFEDVPPESPQYQQLTILEGWGLTHGYPKGTFSGQRALTRYEITVAVQRMSLGASRMLSGYLKAEKPSRPVSEEQSVGIVVAARGTLGNQICALRSLFFEYEPELRILGADVEELNSGLAELERLAGDQAIGLGDPRVRRTEFRRRLLNLQRGNTIERTNGYLTLLHQEIDQPTPPYYEPSGLAWSVKSHDDVLMQILDAADAGPLHQPTLKVAWRNTLPGELRACLAITLTRLEDTDVLPDLLPLAADDTRSVLLREHAIRALGFHPQVEVVRMLLPILQHDATTRDIPTGCIKSGERKSYPLRQAAYASLARLEGERDLPNDEIRAALQAAVLQTPHRARPLPAVQK